MPPSAMTGTPKRLAYSATLYTEVPWGRPHAMTGGIKQIRHDYHGNHPGGKTKQMPSVFLTLKTSKRVLLLQHIFSCQGTLTQRDSLVPMATTEHGPWPITMTTVRGLRVIGFHWQLLLLLSHRGSGLDHEQVQQVQSWLVKTGVTGRGRAGVTDNSSFWPTRGFSLMSRKQQGAITFLCDADGTAAHAHSQSIHASIDQILCLGCRDHWNRKCNSLQSQDSHSLTHSRGENTHRFLQPPASLHISV